MWSLVCFSCLLLISNVGALRRFEDEDPSTVGGVTEGEFWRVIFNTYYNLKGLRNETTDKIVDGFFGHKFEAYPAELYPVFEKIFVHISKCNDRIWNFYESILFFYKNVAAADRVYETVLRRFALGTLLKESGELDTDTDDLLTSEESLKIESATLQDRTGVMAEKASDSEEQPCLDECGIPPLQVGSIRAIPGVHFPNYDDIPITSFNCVGKHIPGFYADLETGCQVFHVCYPHRRETFLCPIGTTFNQAILACDYWYSSNCSLAPLYFGSKGDESATEDRRSLVDQLLKERDTPDVASPTTREPEDVEKLLKPKSPKIKITLPNIDWTLMIKFLPIKSRITECPDFCGTTTTARPTESTTTSTVTGSTVTTSTRPAVTTVPPQKEKDDVKTAKSEILLHLLKAVEVLAKDAEGLLSKILDKEVKQPEVPTRKPRVVVPRLPTEKPKPSPEINPRFVVKPATGVRLSGPSISRSKLLGPSKQILKSKIDAFRKEPAKLVLEGMKAIAHLFD